METALISLVCIVILLIGTVTTVFTSFRAATSVSDSLKEWEKQAAIIRRTDISVVPPDNYHSGNIELWVINEGQTSMNDFPKWDVIAQWQSNDVDQLAYQSYVTAEPLGNNQWTVEGIYLLNGASEMLEPNTLNNGEKVKIIVNLYPSLIKGNFGIITVSTANGVSAQCIVECK
ncbi:MAG: hypothetical protein PHY28_05645 [Dehalococcoidales bacterium]|nr:hypothetical protein [Dehalococcoidales bacterium]